MHRTRKKLARSKSRRRTTLRHESLESRQLLAAAIDDPGIAVTESAPTIIDTDTLLANDQASPATAGALLVYDANLESDNTWNNTGTAAGFNVGLGTPTLINRATGITSALGTIRQAYRFDGNDGGTFGTYQGLPNDPTDADSSWEMVFRPDASGTGQQTLWEVGGNGTGFLIRYNADDQSVNVTIDGGTHTPNPDQVLTVSTAAGSIATDEFTHLVIAYDRDIAGTDRIDVYLNGTAVDSDVETDNDVNDWTGGDGGAFGRPNNSIAADLPTGNYVGDMALIRFYDSTLDATAVASNFAALDLEPVVSVSATTPAGANVTLNGDGTISYDPNGQFEALNLGESGTDTFTYTIDDGAGGTSTATVNVIVVGALDATDGTLMTTADEHAGATFGPTEFPGVAATVAPNAQVVYDAELESDGIWTNTGQQSGLDVDLNGAELVAVDSSLPGITQAYLFDGFSDGGTFASYESAIAGNPTDDSATWELLFRPDAATGGSQTLFEVGGSGNGMLILYNGDDRSVSFVLDGGDDANQLLRVDTATGSIAVNEFNHLVGVYTKNSGGTDVLDVFLNGELVATDIEADDDSDDWAGIDGGGIGVISNAGAIGLVGAPFRGEMNLFRFYDSNLTPSEIIGNYQSRIGPSVSAVTSPTAAGGTVTLNPDSSVSYTLPAGALDELQVGETGTDTFTYSLDDGFGGISTATATVIVNGANDGPTAVDDMFTEAATDEDTPLTIPGPNFNASAQYASEVLTQAPIGFWALNETSGTLAANQGTGGAALDGTYQANVTQGVAGFDPDGDLAVQLNNATDSFVNIDNYPGISGTSPRTVSAWINTTEADAAFTSWGTNSGGQKWTFRVQSGNGQAGAIRLEVNGGYIVGNTIVNDGQWHHVAFTFEDDGTPNVEDVKLFVDGQLDAEVGGAVAPSAVLARSVSTASVADVRIGLDFSNRALGGMIDDVALFDRALTDAEIADQFSATQPSTILDNDIDPEDDPLAIQSYDTVSVGGASVSIDVLQTIGVVGTLGDTLTLTPQTIPFGRDFINPVVIAQPLDSDGADEAVARITSVDAVNDEFTVYVQETPEHTDPNHTTETLFYVVLEAGLWQLPDGSLLEVGTLDTNNTRAADPFETVTFASSFSSTPAVLAQVQTNNDPDYVSTRQDNTSATSFDVILEENEAADGVHGTETIGYVAFSQGSGLLPGGLRYESVTTGTVVDETGDTVNFVENYSSPPLLVAALATFTGPDPTHLRFNNLTSTSVDFEAEEDTSSDTELSHSDEAVSYLAFSSAGEFQAIPQGARIGQFVYDPSGALDDLAAGEVFTDTFTYTVVDPLGETSTATVSVVVTGVNDAPTTAIMGVPETDAAPTESIVGIPVDFSFLATDPDEATGFTFEIDWGDGTMPGTFTDVETVTGTSPQQVSHEFSSIGTFTISVRATDSEGATSTVTTHEIDIVPVAVVGNDLVAGGTASSDTIIFYPSQGGIRVRHNNVTYPLDGGAYSITGNLIANGEDGSDRIVMGQGIELPAIIDGGAGNDYIAGSIANDTVTGGSGNDVILLGEGDNFADGQEDNDRIEGRDGVDILFGGAGNDRLNGGAGNDILDGGTDNDFLFGGLGNDLLVGREGVDTLQGYYGDDVLFGGSDADQIFGGEGQDLLAGGLSVDRIRGDGGDDQVVGGTVGSEPATIAALDAMMATLGTNTLPADPAGNYGAAVDGIDDGVSDDLTGGTGVDTFHSMSDNVRDLRSGETVLP